MNRRPAVDPEDIALRALAFLAGEPDRLGQFLSLAGISPESIREAAASPGFLAGVLDHVAGDEALLLAFAANAGLPPETIGAAQRALSAHGDVD